MKPRLLRRACVAVTAAAVLALTSCTGHSAGEDKVLRLSHFMESTHPVQTCGMETMSQELEGSGLRVEIYPSAQLGGETQSLELVHSGNLDMSINGPSFLGVYDDRFNTLDAAYLFNDREEQREFMTEGGVDPLLQGIYEESGMKVFPGWYYGTRHVSANQEIAAPSDLRGLKLRTPDAPLYRINMTAMGGNPTPLALNELYLGLQQGVVDAQENPLPTIKTMNLESVQSDLSLTGHMVQSIHIAVAGDTWDSLSTNQQETLADAIDEGSRAAYECMVEEEDAVLEEFENGDQIRIHNINNEAFKNQVREELSSGYDFSENYSQIIGATN